MIFFSQETHHFFIDEFHHLNLKKGTSPKLTSLPEILFKKCQKGQYLWIANNPDFDSLTPSEEITNTLIGSGKKRVRHPSTISHLAGNLRNSYEIQKFASCP